MKTVYRQEHKIFCSLYAFITLHNIIAQESKCNLNLTTSNHLNIQVSKKQFLIFGNNTAADSATVLTLYNFLSSVYAVVKRTPILSCTPHQELD